MPASIVTIIFVVFVLGFFGGFVNWLFFREPAREGSPYGLWYYGKGCDTRFPGLPTSVVLGGLGAVAFWCLHGPCSGAVLIGTDAGKAPANLTVGQIPISFFIGMGGSAYLLTEARRRCASSGKNGAANHDREPDLRM